MATLAQWIEGARPRTLPTAISPVLVGTGAALGSGVFSPGRALLALVVSVGLVIGVNYANDYSDGIRGTDDERVGPMRLVGSKVASPVAVRNAALACFAISLLAGLTLVSLMSQWWLIGAGVVCVLGAWFYTGGRHPYGYLGLGELAVFVFFGPVGVLGTMYTQVGAVSAPAVVGSVGTGLLTTAVLVANNLRDIPTDEASGKRTLAVMLGDRDTRRLYAATVGLPFLLTLGTAIRTWPVLLTLVALPLAVTQIRRVLGGADGRKLIRVLRDTGLVLLLWSFTFGVGLAIGHLL